MTYNPVLHHRRSIRLRGHDYTRAGRYFVTLCAARRRPLFGTVVNGRMTLSQAGRIVGEEWLRSAEVRREIVLDEWIVMPDHLHGVVTIQADGQADHAADRRGAPTGAAPRSLGAMIAGFKSASGRRINALLGTPGEPVWHRDYYDTVIRGADALANIRRYIRGNPARADVLRFGEPAFSLGNRNLLSLPKTAFLASRVRATGGSPFLPATGGSPSPAQGATRRSPLRAPGTPPPECVVSAFLSPMERTVFTACLSDRTPLIWVLAHGLPAALPPAAARAVEAGRLLVLTPFPPSVTLCSAQRAAWCNQYVLELADSIVVGHLEPDGMLACLLADVRPEKAVQVLGAAN